MLSCCHSRHNHVDFRPLYGTIIIQLRPLADCFTKSCVCVCFFFSIWLHWTRMKSTRHFNNQPLRVAIQSPLRIAYIIWTKHKSTNQEQSRRIIYTHILFDVPEQAYMHINVSTAMISGPATRHTNNICTQTKKNRLLIISASWKLNAPASGKERGIIPNWVCSQFQPLFVCA